jgi:acyl-[acyl-carrier-protein]-phospholipid O-acyltransferase/long-chain-fatty-acid--[acyl-carrier-protein] ligase
MDDDGFIRITDRIARFSKIGGEMVPHIRVEEAINEILGEYACCVTAVPDEARGERLVALYTKKDIAPGELWQLLSESQLPKLWIPKQENFYCVEGLPTLGTGKLDVRGAKDLARSLAG